MTGQVQNVAENEAQELADVAAEETPTEVQAVEEQPEVKDTGNREAAKYRRQLRETEAQRDELQTQLEAMQKQHIASIIRTHGYNPEGVMLATDLTDFMEEDGRINENQVLTITNTAVQKLGLKRTGVSFPKPDPTQGVSGNAIQETNHWNEAFAPQNRN